MIAIDLTKNYVVPNESYRNRHIMDLKKIGSVENTRSAYWRSKIKENIKVTRTKEAALLGMAAVKKLKAVIFKHSLLNEPKDFVLIFHSATHPLVHQWGPVLLDQDLRDNCKICPRIDLSTLSNFPTIGNFMRNRIWVCLSHHLPWI